MTAETNSCWKCQRNLTAQWDRCPVCGALSRANVEAVCRGIASVAVRVRYDGTFTRRDGERIHECEVAKRLPASHPTRHGAALAAFDAAWALGPRPTFTKVYDELAKLSDQAFAIYHTRLEGDFVMGVDFGMKILEKQPRRTDYITAALLAAKHLGL